MAADDDVTDLLRRWGEGGDRASFDALMPLVTDELRRIAERLFAKERVDHTLQPTALVSEAYIRLVGRRQGQWKSRLHFFCFAAREMRRILVDHARRHSAQKRGRDIEVVPLTKDIVDSAPDAVDILALDAALEQLATIDPHQARLLDLHYFAGLSVDEIGTVQNRARATLYRDLAMARAWIKRALE